jgi:hypothetical protein
VHRVVGEHTDLARRLIDKLVCEGHLHTNGGEKVLRLESAYTIVEQLFDEVRQAERARILEALKKLPGSNARRADRIVNGLPLRPGPRSCFDTSHLKPENDRDFDSDFNGA